MQTNNDFCWARLPGADFSGRDLSGALFSGAELSRANFSSANLTGAKFSGASLAEANFCGADLSRADFFNADLFKANLSRANLTKTELELTDFSKTLLDGTVFDRPPRNSYTAIVMAGLTLRDGYVYGYRASRSVYMAHTEYMPGEVHTSLLSCCPDTECHPGIYFCSQWEAIAISLAKGTDIVSCRARLEDMHVVSPEKGARTRRLEILNRWPPEGWRF